VADDMPTTERHHRLLGRCPACRRRVALFPAGWVRTCAAYVLLRNRRYRCIWCGHEVVNFVRLPWEKR